MASRVAPMPQQKQKKATTRGEAQTLSMFKARSSETDSTSLVLVRNGDLQAHHPQPQNEYSPASVSTSFPESQKGQSQQQQQQQQPPTPTQSQLARELGMQTESLQSHSAATSTSTVGAVFTNTHVLGDVATTPSLPTRTSSVHNSGDYASLVKNTYFVGGGGGGDGDGTIGGPFVRTSSDSTTISNFSLSEMFETTQDHGILSRTGRGVYASAATTTTTTGETTSADLKTQQRNHRRAEQEGDNNNNNGDGDDTNDWSELEDVERDRSDRYDDHQERMHQNGRSRRGGYISPPLTLYSSATIPGNNRSNSNNNNEENIPAYGTESPGDMSPLITPGMDSPFVQNTTNSKSRGIAILDQLLTPSVTSSPGTSCVLQGSMTSSTASSILKQPILYSAIGSLECFNTNSLVTLNNRYMAPSKEFSRPGGGGGMTLHQSLLIPPMTLQQHSNSTTTRHQVQRSNPESLTHTQQLLRRSPYQQRQQRQQHQDPNTNCNIVHQQENGILEISNSSKIPTNGMGPSPTTTTASHKLNGGEVFGVFKRNASYKQQHELNDDDDYLTKELQEGQMQHRQKKRESNIVLGGTTTTVKGKKVENKSSNINNDNTSKTKNSKASAKKVTYKLGVVRDAKKTKKSVEMFRPSSDAYTPRIERKSIKYKTAEARTPVQHMASPMGTLQQPNFRDALRRVAMIIRQHVVKIEGRFEGQSDTKLADDDGLFKASMRDLFHEDNYRTPTYKCNMVRIPMARAGMVYGLRKIHVMYEIPTETEIYDFAHQLFKSVQLSSECSIVCLIYIERLMEIAKVPLLASTWRPIFICGLLLASKVWQDLSSWNIEFTSVYPQFSLEAINRLELNFLKYIKWDLFISSSSYAKYYFALRALVEKVDFRQRYNRMVGGVDNVAQSEALKVQKNTQRVKEEALLQYSRSMPA